MYQKNWCIDIKKIEWVKNKQKLFKKNHHWRTHKRTVFFRISPELDDEYPDSCGGAFNSTRSLAGKCRWSLTSWSHAITIFVSDCELCTRCFTSCVVVDDDDDDDVVVVGGFSTVVCLRSFRSVIGK